MSMVGLFPLLVLIGIVAIVIVTVRRDGAHSGAEGEGAPTALRRLFTYGLLAVAAGFTAGGVAGLLERVFPAGRLLVGSDTTGLARSLAFVIVGGPLAAGLWRVSRRRLLTAPGERASVGWSFVLPATGIISLLVALPGAVEAVEWLAGGEAAAGGAARAIAWGGLWWVCRRLAAHDELSPRRGSNAFVAWEATVGVLAGAGGFAALLGTFLGNAYDRLFATLLTQDLVLEAAAPAAWMVLGGAVWVWSWLFDGRLRPTTAGLDSYRLIVGVFGGLVTALSTGAATLFLVLQWLFGDPPAETASNHFDDLPGVVAWAAAGLAVWWYHRRSVGGPEFESGAERIYRYLVSGTGLAAAAVGLGTVVASILTAASGTQTLAGSSSADILLAGITALVVGAPVWWFNWRAVEIARRAAPSRETHATARRVYLAATLGLAAVVAAVAAAVLVFQVLDGMLEGNSVASITEAVAGSAGTLVAAGTSALFHVEVWRRDRRLPAARPAGPRKVLLVVGGDATELSNRIRRELGSHVTVLRRLDTEAGPEEVDELLATLGSVGDGEVVVTVDRSGIHIIPVSRGS